MKPRYYFSQQPVSKGYYVSAVFRYNVVNVKDLDIVAGIHSGDKKIDLQTEGAELGVVLGKQWWIGRFTTELNIGLGNYFQNCKELVLKDYRYMFGQEGTNREGSVIKYQESRLKIYINWTVGFNVGKRLVNEKVGEP